MKKSKRLLSMLTALTITASAFAGLAIPASAADPTVSYDGWDVTVTADGVTSAVAVSAKYNSETKTLESIHTADLTFTGGTAKARLVSEVGAKIYVWNKLGGDGAIEPVVASPITVETVLSEKTYLDEDFESYEAGNIIKASTGSGVASPADVTNGSLVYSAGHRDAAINDSADIVTESDNKELQILNDGVASAGRGISIAFASDANIPAVIDLGNDDVLELSMRIKAPNSFTVNGFGDIEPSTVFKSTDYVNARFVLDKGLDKQYIVVTDTEGNHLNSTVSKLSASGLTGLSFLINHNNNPRFRLDDIKVVQKPREMSIVDLTVKNKDNAAVPTATITVDETAYTTDNNGVLTIPVTNGTHTIAASKTGYEYTQGMQDSDSQSVTLDNEVKTLAFTISLMSYVKIPDTVEVNSGQVFIAAPKTDTPAKTAAFKVSVIDQYEQPMAASEYTLTWDILPSKAKEDDPDPEADPNVTIDSNGIVSVAQAFSTDDKVQAFDVLATVKTDDRGQTVKGKLYVGNMDIIHFEPEWKPTERNGSYTFAKELSLPDVMTVSYDISFKKPDKQTTVALMSENNKLVGLQLSFDSSDEKGTVKAWTGWNGHKDMNQDLDSHNNNKSDVDAFDQSATLFDKNYTYGEKIQANFTINKEASNVTVSYGDGQNASVLPYTVTADKLTALQYGTYRNGSVMSIENVIFQEPDANYLSVNGVSRVAKISDKDVTRQYTLGQSMIDEEEVFNWSVAPASAAVQVSQSGLLTVTDEATPGAYTISAAGTKNTDKHASYTVQVENFQQLTNSDVDISGPRAYEYGKDTTGTYAITRMVDSIGDDVTALLAAPTWSSSNTEVATINASTGELTVVGKGVTTITATIVNGTATSTLTVPVIVGTFSKTETTNVAAGSTIDISSLVSNDKVTGYQVTVADAEKNQLAKSVVQASGGNVTVPAYTGTAASVEVTPVFSYDFGDPGSLGSVGEGKDIPVPSGTYNFTVKDTGGRTDVYANDQMLVNNILQGGSTVNTLDVNDIVITGGNARIYTADRAGTPNLTITAAKSPSNVNRKRKMYVLGDSLVCIYYNGGSAANNTLQTGWGQVLQNYIKDDVEVVDLANSGVTAEGLAGSAITQVAQSAKSGDIVLIESGYNDRSYSTTAKMTEAVNSMIDKAKAKGASVVLVTPNASQHDYKADVVWSSTMKTIASDKGVPCIDLAALSYEFLNGKYGNDTTTVKATYNVSDGLHSQYRGAMKFAAIVAQGLYGMNDYKSIIKTSSEFSYSFEDTKGDTITCEVTAN